MAIKSISLIPLAAGDSQTLISGETALNPTDTFPVTNADGIDYGIVGGVSGGYPLFISRTTENVSPIRFPTFFGVLNDAAVGYRDVKVTVPVGATVTVSVACGEFDNARSPQYVEIRDGSGLKHTVTSGTGTSADNKFLGTDGGEYTGRDGWLSGQTAYTGTFDGSVIVRTGNPAGGGSYSMLAGLFVSWTVSGGSGVIENDNLQGGVQSLSGGLQG